MYIILIIALYFDIIGGIILLIRAKALGIPFVLAVLLVVFAIVLDLAVSAVYGRIEAKHEKMFRDDEETDVDEKVMNDLGNDNIIKYNVNK